MRYSLMLYVTDETGDVTKWKTEASEVSLNYPAPPYFSTNAVVANALAQFIPLLIADTQMKLNPEPEEKLPKKEE